MVFQFDATTPPTVWTSSKRHKRLQVDVLRLARSEFQFMGPMNDVLMHGRPGLVISFITKVIRRPMGKDAWPHLRFN